MDKENIINECLWLLEDGPKTTKQLTGELDVEFEQIEHSLRNNPIFEMPFDKEGSRRGEGNDDYIYWKLTDDGKFHLTTLEPNVEEIREAVIKNFSEDVWRITDVCLSVISTLLLSDVSNPTGLNLVGPPSDNKTTVLSFFYGIDGITIKSDNFTPKAFVSHAANVSSEKLEEIDLLPRMRYKCLIVPELAPIFGRRKEDLIENLSILTRVFDGEGYESDSGMRGHRGYSGDYLFSWLGATTPFSYTVWKVMGKMGMRWVFLNTPNKERDDNKLASMLTSEKPFKDKIKACRRPVNRLLKTLWIHGPKYIKWNKKGDSVDIISTLVKFGKIVAKLRSVIDVYGYPKEDGNTMFSFNDILSEKPERVLTILYNIARSHAVVHGRRKLEPGDLEVVWGIVCSSMPKDRSAVFSLLVKNGGIVIESDIKKVLRCSGSTAKKIMKTLAYLDIVDFQEYDDRICAIEIKPEYSWIHTWRRDLSQDKS